MPCIVLVSLVCCLLIYHAAISGDSKRTAALWAKDVLSLHPELFVLLGMVYVCEALFLSTAHSIDNVRNDGWVFFLRF